MSGITERTKVITGDGPYRAPSALVSEGALFAWSCRTGEAEHGELVSVCEISGTDPVEYAAHMRGHGRRSPAAAVMPPMWKPPARKDYAPRATDPGEVIVWTVRIGAHWTVPPRYDDGTSTFTEGIGWVETVEYERIGTIWSQATSASSWWAVPEDDDPEPVVVRKAGKSHRGEWAEGQLFQSGECRNWRDGIRRAENVRRRGVYAVALTEPMRDGSGPYSAYSYVCWHSDPDCPAAAGQEREVRAGGWTLHRIVDVLAGRERYSGKLPFCPRCVMLEDSPVAARDLVTA